jgi:hypothetical protein
MTWLKRHLFWVIGGVIALGLLGGAFFYLYTNMQSEKEIDEQLNQKLARWDELLKAGNDSREPIEAVKEDEKKLQGFLGETRKFFTPVPYPAIRDNREFRFLLDTTLNGLERSAEASAVTLPPKPFGFTFKPQSESVQFESANLQPLTMQLAEIAAISEILFKAKIHSLEGVRRVPITKDDIGATDYLDRKAVTNTIGNLLEIHVPYEFTFRCFSAELGEGIEGLARSPHCFLVKSLNTETTTPGSANQPGGERPGDYPSMIDAERLPFRGHPRQRRIRPGADR